MDAQGVEDGGVFSRRYTVVWAGRDAVVECPDPGFIPGASGYVLAVSGIACSLPHSPARMGSMAILQWLATGEMETSF